MAEPPPLLELRRVSKRFPGVLANDAVDLSLQAGEVLALLGENGAGKSTLAGMLAGLTSPDSGEIFMSGRPMALDSPAIALAAGIGAVQQHFSLVPTLTVAENLLLGQGGLLHRPDRRAASERFSALCQEFDVTIDPAARAGSLSLGEQQLVEVCRAVLRGSRILVLDEPTAMLTPGGSEKLLDILWHATGRGAAALFITHKLDEALAAADRITVLRRGRVVGTFLPKRTDREALLAAMFGDERKPPSLAGGGFGRGRAVLDSESSPPPASPPFRTGRPREVLRVKGITLRAPGRPPVLDNVSFTVNAGEILGIAGIDGNGQTPLAEILAGQRAADAGTVVLDGADMSAFGVAARHRRGLRYVTDDRLGEGTVGSFPVAVNLLLKRIGAAPFWRHGVARPAAMAAHAAHRIDEFDIRAASPWAPVKTLSGGNVQKLLLARELENNPRLVICNKPTHGLDALTQAATRRRIAEQAEAGVACLLISPDLPELFFLAHRICVMRDGRLLGPLPNAVGARLTVQALLAGGPAS